MKYDFTTIVDRNNTSALKTNEEIIKNGFGANYFEDTIPMWVADMDFKCPEKIKKALSNRVNKEVFGYTVFNDEYYDSIINWYKKRHDMEIQKEWIVYSEGTVKAIRDCLRAFTKEGEGIIIQPPVYYPFAAQIKETKRKVISNSLKKDENNIYTIDFENFEEKCKDPNNTLFIFCNPHNPIGEIWRYEDIQRLIDICKENNVLFFSDEIHSDIVREGEKAISALNLDNNEDIIIATAANKTFNLAGLHITNLVIKNKEIKSQLAEYTGTIMPSPFTLDATIAAYTECEDWVLEMNKVINENFRMMEEFFIENMPKIKFNLPKGTYLAWIDFRGYGLSEEDVVLKCSDIARVIVEGGSIFGLESKGFVRVNVACPTRLLKEALMRIKLVFEK